MNWLDGILVGIIGVSALISLVRGFVREVLSLVVWIAAFWLSVRYTEALARYGEAYVGSPTLRLIGAFAALFIITLIVGALLNYMASVLVGRTGLSGTDRTLGVVFGGLRGVFIAALLVLIAGLTAVPREGWWQGSLLTTHLQPWVCAVGVEGWLADFDLRQPVVGDAVNPEGTSAAAYWQEFCAVPSSQEESADVSATTGAIARYVWRHRNGGVRPGQSGSLRRAHGSAASRPGCRRDHDLRRGSAVSA